MIIFGITGTLGAGKGTVVEYLVNKKGFSHYSVGDYISNLIRERNLSVNRDNMVVIANEYREKYHPAYFAERLYKQAESAGKNAVIESIRTPGEVEYLRQRGRFVLIAVDAPAKLRYERIQKRQSVKDDVSFEKFVADEQRENNNTEPYKQNLKRCIEMADYKMQNDGSLEELHIQIEAMLKECGGRGL